MPNSRKKNVIFIGTKRVGFECLSFLLSEQKNCGIRVAGVLTSAKGSFSEKIAERANASKIPVFKNLDEITEQKDIDFIICVQYPLILKKQHIETAKKLAVNLHMAPLPEYRGCNQFSFAIVEGKNEFGTTLHVMETGIDSGDIIAEKRFPIPKDCFVEDLYELTVQKSIELFKESAKKIFDGAFTAIPQSTLAEKRGTSYHFRHEIDSLKKIDLSWEQDRIERHLRATLMPGFEGPYVEVAGKKITFTIT